MHSKILTVLTLLFSFNSIADVSITAVNNSEDELKIKHELELLQKTHDLSPWIITDTIEVDEKARTPRSHPVLTMSTQEEYLNNDIKLLSSFLHEQFHWHVIKNGRGSKSEFRAAIKAEFPNVQFERPFGSGTEGGTLSHIVICYLEYIVLSELIGKEHAIKNISANEYYIWVYQTILNPTNHGKLDRLVQKFGLGFGVKNS